MKSPKSDKKKSKEKRKKWLHKESLLMPNLKLQNHMFPTIPTFLKGIVFFFTFENSTKVFKKTHWKNSRPKSTPVREESKPVSNNAPRKAMQLKKAGATNDYLKQMQQAGEIIAESPKSRAASSNSNSATPKAPEIAEEA